MDWFRFYHEFSTDPKVQMMPEAYQRRLTMLFCFRCNDNVTLHDEEITFQLRISPEEWAATKAEFIKREFIDADNNILNWNKRQYISDSSNQRVKKHREKKKQECNVTVTTPDTEQKQIQNREEEKEKATLSPKKPKTKKEAIEPEAFKRFWEAYPRKRRGNKENAMAAWNRAICDNRATSEEIENGLGAYRISREATDNGGQFAKGCAAWLNDDRWTHDYAKPAGGNNSKQGASYTNSIRNAGDRALEHLRRMDGEDQGEGGQGLWPGDIGNASQSLTITVRQAEHLPSGPHGQLLPSGGSFEQAGQSGSGIPQQASAQGNRDGAPEAAFDAQTPEGRR